MELSEKSFTGYMQSKLLDCKQACAGLNNELSVLEERWQPKGLHMDEREDEVRMMHEELKECIADQQDVAFDCDFLKYQMQILENKCADLEMYNKDSKEQIKEYTTMIEDIQKDNEKKELYLRHAEDKIKELHEKNNCMLLQLSGRKCDKGAESSHSSSASANYNRESK